MYILGKINSLDRLVFEATFFLIRKKKQLWFYGKVREVKHYGADLSVFNNSFWIKTL